MSAVIVVSDTSIQNNITTPIIHIHAYFNPIKKILHYTVNIYTTKAELFAIRCGINQAIQITNISYIIIITDSIYLACYIFYLFIHLYQQQSIVILKNIRLYFNKQPDNIIEF